MVSINIGGYLFDGPYFYTSSLDDRSGVYAIICERITSSYILDIGESSEVRTRVENHDRKDCWERNCTGTIKYAVYYTPHLQKSGRREIEEELRRKYNPPCGYR